MANEYGRGVFQHRRSDPYWFQALGYVFSCYWQSSGVTTVLTGVLKNTLKPKEHGLTTCGGKGKVSHQAELDQQNFESMLITCN